MTTFLPSTPSGVMARRSAGHPGDAPPTVQGSREFTLESSIRRDLGGPHSRAMTGFFVGGENQ
jgi:hypothetical protein